MVTSHHFGSSTVCLGHRYLLVQQLGPKLSVITTRSQLQSTHNRIATQQTFVPCVSNTTRGLFPRQETQLLL